MRVCATLFFGVLALSAVAQQDLFQWRLAAHAGVTRSLSDIRSSYSDVDWGRSRVYGLELSKAMGYGISLGLEVNSVRLSGYDVKTGRSDRALNFMSKLRTAELDLTFRMDNGRLLKYDARFAPFLSIGVGVGRYNTFGDLSSASGSRYNYWSDGTIRDKAETSANAASALVIEPDEKFETRLTKLATEDGKPKRPDFFFIPARIGLKWRICDRFAAEGFYGFNWTFNDHIDDVHGAYPAETPQGALAYASNPTGRSGMRGDPDTDDKYHSIGLNLAYYFGRRSHSFRMNPIHVDDRSLPPSTETAPKTVIVPKPAPQAPELPPQSVIINVERIIVGSLSVDTLIVGKLQVQDTAMRDTSQRLTTPTTPLDSIMALDPMLHTGMDSLRRDSLSSLRTESTKALLTDTLQKPLVRDTVAPLPIEPEPRSVVDSIAPTRPDTLTPSSKRDTTMTLKPDTTSRSGMEPIEPPSTLDSLPSLPQDPIDRVLPDSLQDGGSNQDLDHGRENKIDRIGPSMSLAAIYVRGVVGQFPLARDQGQGELAVQERLPHGGSPE